jgi:hypothetical protein
MMNLKVMETLMILGLGFMMLGWGDDHS